MLKDWRNEFLWKTIFLVVAVNLLILLFVLRDYCWTDELKFKIARMYQDNVQSKNKNIRYDQTEKKNI